jgi:hypothetical protein
MLLEAGIKIVPFALIARATQSLEVTDVVRTPTRKRNNVIDRQAALYVCLSTTLALIVVTLKNIASDRGGNFNARSFTHRGHQRPD